MSLSSILSRVNGKIPEDHPVLKEEATLLQTLEIVRKLKASRVLMTHIEEPDQLSHDNLQLLGDSAYAIGSVDGALTPRAGGEPKPIRFRVFWLLRRENGGWKIYRQIWNNKPAS